MRQCLAVDQPSSDCSATRSILKCTIQTLLPTADVFARQRTIKKRKTCENVSPFHLYFVILQRETFRHLF